jgi:hypothetical protein
MKSILFSILILGVQTGFAQTNKPDKLYQFYKNFKEVEDSIAATINQNILRNKTGLNKRHKELPVDHLL